MPHFLAPIDLNKNELRNAKAHPLASPPSPGVGDLGYFYYDTTNHLLKVWNGTSFDSASVTDATTLAKGVVQLAGDLAGTAALPVVASLAITAAKIANATITDTQVAAANKDGVVGTASMRTLGSGAQQAMAGNTRLDQIPAPTASVSLNTQKITSLVDPTNPQEAATKAYVDAVAVGLNPKPSSRLATTAALAANVYANGTAGVGATLTASANGALTVDSVAVAVGDIILVKDEATLANNGLYTVTATGSAGAVYVLTRHATMDQSGDIVGAHSFVEAGTVWTGNGFVVTLPAQGTAVTVGTTGITWTQFTGTGDISAGNGITKTGNTLSVNNGAGLSFSSGALLIAASAITNAMLAGSIDLTTKVTGSLPILNGGTAGTTAVAARQNLGSTGFYNNANTHASATTIVINQATHGLAANRKLLVQVIDTTTASTGTAGDVVFPDINVSSGGVVTITFATAPTLNTMDVTIIGAS